LPKMAKPNGGRPSLLTDGEMATILVWNTITVKQKNLKDI